MDGERFRVLGSGGGFAAFLEDGILVSQPSPLGNAIKLSGRTFLAPHRGAARRGKQVATTLILTAFVCRLKVLFIEIRNTSHSSPATSQHAKKPP